MVGGFSITVLEMASGSKGGRVRGSCVTPGKPLGRSSGASAVSPTLPDLAARLARQRFRQMPARPWAPLTGPRFSCITNSWISAGNDWNMEHVARHGVSLEEAE